MEIRLTRPTREVLRVLLTGPAWGLKICEDADLGTGTVYPILDRLSKVGWVTSYEERPGSHPGRPARRYYELTDVGFDCAEDAIRPLKLRTS